MVDRERVYDNLVEIACQGKTITYNELAALLGLNLGLEVDRLTISQILGEITYAEDAAGRPLLSAVVVLSEIGYPKKDFFMIARELRYNEYADERSYYEYELKRVHNYWKSTPPAPKTVHTHRPGERRARLLPRVG